MALCPRLHAMQVDQLKLGQLLDQVGDQLLHLIIQRAMQKGAIGRQAQAHAVSANPGGDSLGNLQARKCVPVCLDWRLMSVVNASVQCQPRQAISSYSPSADSAECTTSSDILRALCTRMVGSVIWAERRPPGRSGSDWEWSRHIHQCACCKSS